MQNDLIYVWIYPQQIQQKWQSYTEIRIRLQMSRRYV